MQSPNVNLPEIKHLHKTECIELDWSETTL